METLLIAGIVGFITFIAGRGMVGSNKVTREHAEAVAREMYTKGLQDGRNGRASATPDQKLVSASAAQALACDEYLKGFYVGMKAVRTHGDQADKAMEDHLISVMKQKTDALLQR